MSEAIRDKDSQLVKLNKENAYLNNLLDCWKESKNSLPILSNKKKVKEQDRES